MFTSSELFLCDLCIYIIDFSIDAINTFVETGFIVVHMPTVDDILRVSCTRFRERLRVRFYHIILLSMQYLARKRSWSIIDLIAEHNIVTCHSPEKKLMLLCELKSRAHQAAISSVRQKDNQFLFLRARFNCA